MRTSRTVRMSLVTRIRGIDTADRLRQTVEAAGWDRVLGPLDNGTRLCVVPGGATHHFAIEGDPAAVEDVIRRLKSWKPVCIPLSEEAIRILEEEESASGIHDMTK